MLICTEQNIKLSCCLTINILMMQINVHAVQDLLNSNKHGADQHEIQIHKM